MTTRIVTIIPPEQRRTEALAVMGLGWILNALDLSISTLVLETSGTSLFPESVILADGQHLYIHQLPDYRGGLRDTLDEYANLLPSDCTITALRCGDLSGRLDVATAVRVRVPGYISNNTDAHTSIIEAIRSLYPAPIRTIELIPVRDGDLTHYSETVAVTTFDGTVTAITLQDTDFHHATAMLRDLYGDDSPRGFLIPVNDRA